MSMSYVLVGVVSLIVVAYLVWKLWPNRQPEVQPECGKWKAWHDLMPGPNRTPTLNVTGECKFPTAGYSVELIKHSPQGINPAYLLLDKIVHAPSGSVAEVSTIVPAAYSEATDIKHEFVTILPDNVTIPVENVH